VSGNAEQAKVPPRMSGEILRRLVLAATIVLLAAGSLSGSGVSLQTFIEGIPSILSLARDMWPPDFRRIDSIAHAIFVTLQIAVAGTFLGLCGSLLAGVLGSRHQSPSAWLRVLVKVMLAGVRTIPELLWALLFVVSVGPGAFAGVLAICMDTLGFAGRFFAEALDDVDSDPQAALLVHGASRSLVLFGVVFPLAMPSLLHTSLYSLERAIRASVVLGVVGAGGIGIELKVAMDLFQYRKAAAMVICILVVVVAVEAFGTWARLQLRPK